MLIEFIITQVSNIPSYFIKKCQITFYPICPLMITSTKKRETFNEGKCSLTADPDMASHRPHISKVLFKDNSMTANKTSAAPNQLENRETYSF